MALEPRRDQSWPVDLLIWIYVVGTGIVLILFALLAGVGLKSAGVVGAGGNPKVASTGSREASASGPVQISLTPDAETWRGRMVYTCLTRYPVRWPGWLWCPLGAAAAAWIAMMFVFALVMFDVRVPGIEEVFFGALLAPIGVCISAFIWVVVTPLSARAIGFCVAPLVAILLVLEVFAYLSRHDPVGQDYPYEFGLFAKPAGVLVILFLGFYIFYSPVWPYPLSPRPPAPPPTQDFWPENVTVSESGHLVTEDGVPVMVVSDRVDVNLFKSKDLEYPAGVIANMKLWGPHFTFEKVGEAIRVSLAPETPMGEFYVKRTDCWTWRTGKCVAITKPVRVYASIESARAGNASASEEYAYQRPEEMDEGGLDGLPVLDIREGLLCFLRPRPGGYGCEASWMRWNGADPGVKLVNWTHDGDSSVK